MKRLLLVMGLVITCAVVAAAVYLILEQKSVVSLEAPDPQRLGPHPPPGPEYRGDHLEFASKSQVFMGLQPTAKQAYLHLANAQVFGFNPPLTISFRKVLTDPRALGAFRELATKATPEGQLYGLCGLYLLQASDFAKAKVALASAPKARVHIQDYDLGSTASMSDVLPQIADGTYPKLLKKPQG